MDNMTKFKQDITSVESHCQSLTGKTLKNNFKAIKDLARNLVVALHETGKNVDEYLDAYHNDKILNPSFVFVDGANWRDYVDLDWLDFCNVMFELRPVGLGTPNAMVGEAEFMLVFGSPRVTLSKKKNAGDIVVDNKTVELKGADMRIMGAVKGKEVQSHAAKVAAKYHLSPNDCTKARKAFEPWAKESHWQKEFAKIGVDASKNFLADLCSIFMQCSPNDFDPCFSNNFSSAELLKVMLKGLWANSDKLWDSYTVIDNGTISSLGTQKSQFDKLVNEGYIVVTENYFRSFQDTNVGLYVTIKK